MSKIDPRNTVRGHGGISLLCFTPAVQHTPPVMSDVIPPDGLCELTKGAKPFSTEIAQFRTQHILAPLGRTVPW